MKRLVLGFMMLSSLVFAGDKIKFTSANVMCPDKNPKLLTYLMVLTIAIEKGVSAIENAKNTITTDSGGTCGILNPSTNVIAKIVKKQKDVVKGTPIEYIQYELITVNGKSMNNFKMWSVVIPNSGFYKIID